MSLELIATIICDGCGERATSESENKFGNSKWFATWHKAELEKAGWVTVSRGRYHTEAHCCPKCADKPLKPIKGKPRWKGPEVTEQIRKVLHPRLTIPDKRSVWVLAEGKKRLTIGRPCRVHSGAGSSTYWQLKGHRKHFLNGQITGWIHNHELTALIGEVSLS